VPKTKIIKELIKRAGEGEQAALQFLHNTSAEKLVRIQGMGGMPMPSIGVTKKDIAFENFGDITLVGKPESFDPKASRLNQAFSADAYTVRAPSPVRIAKKGAGENFQKGIGAKLKAEGKYIDETASNLWGLERKGDIKEHEYNQVKRFLDSDELMDEFFEPEEYFISNPNRDHYTTRAKLQPYTADNVTKFMKRSAGQGGEGGMTSTGLGAQRASTATEFKSLPAMKKRQGDLISKDQMKAIKEQGEEEFFELADELKKYYKYESESFRYLDEVGELITMSEKRGLSGAFKEIGFEDVPEDLINDINTYKDRLRSAPTEYFESKPKRVVDLEEFGGAIVPEDTPKETIEMLQNKGLRVEKYKDDAGRLAARSKFQDLAFQGTGVAAVGIAGTESDEAEANPLVHAVKHLAKYGHNIDTNTLTSAQKYNLTRYGKSLTTPAVKRRENLRGAGETIIASDDFGANRYLKPEELQGKVLVPVVGDRSVTGQTLTNVGGVPLDRPVRIEGGPDFPLQREGSGLGWASMLGAARSKQANITKAAAATGSEPVGVYSAMGSEAINFSTPVAESMLAQLAAIKVPKTAKAQFSKVIKKEHPDFVGLDSPDLFDQIMGRGGYPKEGAGALRKTVVAEMSKARWRDKGFPVYEDVAEAITDPNLAGLDVGDAGYSMFAGKPGADLLEDATHQSYNRGIPGDYMGGLPESVPPEIMFPDVFDTLSQQKNVAGQLLLRDQQIGALRAKHLWQPANQKWVDNISRYLEGGKVSAIGASTIGAATSLTSPESQASTQAAIKELQRRGLGHLIPTTDTIKAAKYPNLQEAANVLRGVATPIGAPYEATADMLQAWAYGEHPDKLDYVLSPMEVTDPSMWPSLGARIADYYLTDR